jgi:FkbM family methyltransferase
MSTFSRAKRRLRHLKLKVFGVRLRSGDIKARGDSPSDVFVFNEIFGPEDAYHRETLIPQMRGGTVVEVGAHKGYFTVLAASVAEKVVVFEPADHNYDLLVKNLNLNGAENTTALKQAVSATAGPRTFTISDHTDARHTFFASPFSGNGGTAEVECTTLPALLRDFELDEIDVLKLDCEGSEYDVLLGVDPDVVGRIKNIVLEVHEAPTIPHTRTELVSFLESNGFSTEIYDENVRDGGLRTCMATFTRAKQTEAGGTQELPAQRAPETEAQDPLTSGA